jgi:hypothetical protein
MRRTSRRPGRRPDLPGQMTFRFRDDIFEPGPPCLACGRETQVIPGIGPNPRPRIQCTDPGCAVWRWATPVKPHWRSVAKAP